MKIDEFKIGKVMSLKGGGDWWSEEAYLNFAMRQVSWCYVFGPFFVYDTW